MAKKTAFPNSIPELLSKARRFSQGLGALTGELGFEPNTLQEVNELISAISNFDQTVQGGRGELNQILLPELRKARAGVRIFAAEARDLLKPLLGRQWNLGWAEAGFRNPGSLAIPSGNDLQEALVMALAAYLESHPPHENKPAGITGAKARSTAARLSSAAKAVAEAQEAITAKIEQRDQHVRRLRVALRNLINRLRLVLTKDDRRWALLDLKAPAEAGSSGSAEELAVVTGIEPGASPGVESRLAA